VRDVVLREAVLTHVVHRLGALVAVVPIPVWGHRREQLARLHLLLEIEEPEIDQLLRDWDQLGHLTLRGLARLFVVGEFDASLPMMLVNVFCPELGNLADPRSCEWRDPKEPLHEQPVFRRHFLPVHLRFKNLVEVPILVTLANSDRGLWKEQELEGVDGDDVDLGRVAAKRRDRPK
jgi:hypothetical protein